MSNVHKTSTSSNGTNTLTQAAGLGAVWNLTSLQISFAGPTIGPNVKLRVYDGSTSGTLIFSIHLPGPSGSVGTIHDVALPKDALGRPVLQASPDNAMTIVVDGFGANECSINARITDGLPGAE